MCEFDEPELEEGKVTRVQEYSPAFRVCDLDYVGKITVREEWAAAGDNLVMSEVYQAFVIPESKIIGKNGNEIPHDKLIERIPIGSEVDYIFKERVQKKPFKRSKGVIVEMKVRG